MFGTAVLVAWNVPFGLHIVGYLFASMDGPLVTIVLAWTNVLLAHDSQTRALTLGLMNAFGNAVTLLIQQFLFPVTSAPEYKKGFRGTVGFMIGLLIWQFVVRILEIGFQAKIERVNESVSEINDISYEIVSVNATQDRKT